MQVALRKVLFALVDGQRIELLEALISMYRVIFKYANPVLCTCNAKPGCAAWWSKLACTCTASATSAHCCSALNAVWKPSTSPAGPERTRLAAQRIHERRLLSVLGLAQLGGRRVVGKQLEPVVGRQRIGVDHCEHSVGRLCNLGVRVVLVVMEPRLLQAS